MLIKISNYKYVFTLSQSSEKSSNSMNSFFSSLRRSINLPLAKTTSDTNAGLRSGPLSPA